MKTYRPTGEIRSPKGGELCATGDGLGVMVCPKDGWSDSPRAIYEAVDDAPCPDSVMEEIVALHRSRSVTGLKKYGVTLDRVDLSFDQWAEHLLTELMDACGYVQRLRRKAAEPFVLTAERAVADLASLDAEIKRDFAARTKDRVDPLAAVVGWASPDWIATGVPTTVHAAPRMEGGKPVDVRVMVIAYPEEEPAPCPPSTSPA